MYRILYEMKHKDGSFIHSPPLSPPSPLSSPYSISYANESTPSLSPSRISPLILLIVVIVSIIFFISSLLHLLVRYLIKRPPSLPNPQPNSYPETPASHSFQRQLQELFMLHDSGVDQSVIDALPVFYYKDIVGLKGPFDCAVCLCEFSDQDKLRLIPTCSHAFHITCIETWLLSNSTCPLCRGTLSSFEVLREISIGFSSDVENGTSGHHKPDIIQKSAGPKRVFSVRLGKFRSLNGENGRERGQGEMSSSNLDARRCYSTGAFQYVVVDSDLQMSLTHNSDCADGVDNSSNTKLIKERRNHENSLGDGEREGKKISGRSRGESFSVSKIWLWSKKSRLPSSSSNARMAELGLASSFSYYKFDKELHRTQMV